MNKDMMKKLLSKGYEIGMKILPVCAMAMVIINTNSTGCWLNSQPEPPASVKKYRKF